MSGSALRIEVDDLSRDAVRALLAEHLRHMHEITPPESIHALDLDGLRQPDITFWTAWDGDALAGCAALKELSASHGEVKSMRTPSGRRRRGVARALLEHLLAQARLRGYRRLSLETGSMPAFEPARRLYQGHGFHYCGPFAGYADDPNSVFMTREL